MSCNTVKSVFSRQSIKPLLTHREAKTQRDTAKAILKRSRDVLSKEIANDHTRVDKATAQWRKNQNRYSDQLDRIKNLRRPTSFLKAKQASERNNRPSQGSTSPEDNAITKNTATTKDSTVTTKDSTVATKDSTVATKVSTIVDVTSSPYRLLVGTNLDFNEKAIDVNGLYAKVDVLIDNQHGGTYASNWLLKNISLIGNIYLNQSLSGDYSDTLSRRRTDRTLIRSLSNDTVTAVAVAAINVKTVTRVKSLGFVLQPTIRLFNNQDPPESPLVHPHSSFYAGLHLEVARRAYITNYSYSEPTPLDTLRIPKLPTQPYNYALATSRTTEETVIFYERYYGISLPYRYISNDIDLRFIPSFGLAYLYPGEYIRYMTATLDITERNSGITFGAEIRDYASVRQRPVLSLYISKAFLLNRLGALLNGRT